MASPRSSNSWEVERRGGGGGGGAGVRAVEIFSLLLHHKTSELVEESAPCQSVAVERVELGHCATRCSYLDG